MKMKQDQLSSLPKPILHAILSKLSKKDTVRTSVLSKAWNETWSTFPMLSFSDTDSVGSSFQPTEEFVRKKHIFLNYVKRILLRFRDQGLAIREFKLSMSCLDPYYISNDVDLWMKLASESGIEALEFYQSDYDREEDEEGWNHCYILSIDFSEAKALTKLVLNGKLRVDLAFRNYPNKFFKLQVLSLEDVLLGDGHEIEHFLSQCSLIERVTLKRCHVLNPDGEGHPQELSTSLMKSLSLCGLPNLKGVDIEGIHEVYIDAPSLENLCYYPGTLLEPFKLNSNRCKNLKEICLRFLSTIITDNWFLELFGNFPFLESLKLDGCAMFERINIPSIKLKVLILAYCSGLKEVYIDAPSLLSYRHIGYGAAKPIICFLSSSRQMEVEVVFHVDDINHCNLREFIQNIKPQSILVSISLVIHSLHVDALNPVVFQNPSLPPSIKHLELCKAPENKASYLPLFNTLLSSCCPTTISLTLHPSFKSRAFIEFFYETIKGGKEHDCFCHTGHAKCWWHDLKDVKVSSSIMVDENVDFKSILDAMPAFSPCASNTISFSFGLEF